MFQGLPLRRCPRRDRHILAMTGERVLTLDEGVLDDPSDQVAKDIGAMPVPAVRLRQHSYGIPTPGASLKCQFGPPRYQEG